MPENNAYYPVSKDAADESPFVEELLAEMDEETEHPLPLEDDGDSL